MALSAVRAGLGRAAPCESASWPPCSIPPLRVWPRTLRRRHQPRRKLPWERNRTVYSYSHSYFAVLGGAKTHALLDWQWFVRVNGSETLPHSTSSPSSTFQ